MTQETKAVYWQKHLSNWQQSGLTQKEYCTQHALKLANLSYWRKRLGTPVTPSKLIPLTLPHPSNVMAVISLAGLKIEIPLESLEKVLPIIQHHLQGSR